MQCLVQEHWHYPAIDQEEQVQKADEHSRRSWSVGTSEDEAISFVEDKFLHDSLQYQRYRRVYTHLATLTDIENVKVIVNGIKNCLIQNHARDYDPTLLSK